MSQVTVEQALQIGIQHHQAGQLQQAENIYRQILAHQPNHADSLHLLGLISHQSRQNETAVDLMRRAIAIRPNWPDAHYNLAIALRASGQLDDAIAAYKQAIAQRADFADAHNGLAGAFQAIGKSDEAIAAYQLAATLNPNKAEVFNNLGVLLQNKGKLQEAIAVYRKAIAKKSDYSEAYANLGIALRQSGELDEAVGACRQAIVLNSQSAIAFDNLGLALQEKGDIDGAIAVHRHAISLIPNSVDSIFNLGNALVAKGSLDDAIDAYRAAIAINPDYAAAHNNLGKVLIDVGQVNAAVAAFGRAASAQPENPAYDSAFIFSLFYQPGGEALRIAEQHFRWGRLHAPPVEQVIQPHYPSDRRLRIGYISPDFRNHPVGRFLLPLLQNHNHAQFEIFCYSDTPRPDDITARLRSAADHWQNTANLAHHTVAKKIRGDEIDILVDLTGHTTGSRLLVFASNPAPVQVSYLGYPGTTGMTAIDYRLTDHLADPVGLTEHLHTETLYRLPKTNWCYAEVTDSPTVAPPPVFHRGYVTFGSFNNLAKVTDGMLQTWRRILDEVPKSRLLLKASALVSAKARERINQLFTDRVTLLGSQPNHSTHLATYGEIDIALDTFPYHGTTTTCDALWMGVPVVSLTGQSHISRVGLSLLTNVGLPDLAAATIDQYVNIAVALANDPQRLKAMRLDFRNRMKNSPLMDALNFTRDIEAAYHQMFKQLTTGT